MSILVIHSITAISTTSSFPTETIDKLGYGADLMTIGAGTTAGATAGTLTVMAGLFSLAIKLAGYVDKKYPDQLFITRDRPKSMQKKSQIEQYKIWPPGGATCQIKTDDCVQMGLYLFFYGKIRIELWEKDHCSPHDRIGVLEISEEDNNESRQVRVLAQDGIYIVEYEVIGGEWRIPYGVGRKFEMCEGVSTNWCYLPEDEEEVLGITCISYKNNNKRRILHPAILTNKNGLVAAKTESDVLSLKQNYEYLLFSDFRELYYDTTVVRVPRGKKIKGIKFAVSTWDDGYAMRNVLHPILYCVNSEGKGGVDIYNHGNMARIKIFRSLDLQVMERYETDRIGDKIRQVKGFGFGAFSQQLDIYYNPNLEDKSWEASKVSMVMTPIIMAKKVQGVSNVKNWSSYPDNKNFGAELPYEKKDPRTRETRTIQLAFPFDHLQKAKKNKQRIVKIKKMKFGYEWGIDGFTVEYEVQPYEEDIDANAILSYRREREGKTSTIVYQEGREEAEWNGLKQEEMILDVVGLKILEMWVVYQKAILTEENEEWFVKNIILMTQADQRSIDYIKAHNLEESKCFNPGIFTTKPEEEMTRIVRFYNPYALFGTYRVIESWGDGKTKVLTELGAYTTF